MGSAVVYYSWNEIINGSDTIFRGGLGNEITLVHDLVKVNFKITCIVLKSQTN